MAINSHSLELPATILVVEDDNELRELLHTQLELEGYYVFTAHNGAVAIGKAQAQKPDVILMDVLMPEMNGIEATKRLKHDEDTRHIPVIMVTSEHKKEDMIKGLEAGAIDYVTKPFYLPELKARVKAVLRLKYIYDDLIRMRKELVKKEMSHAIKEVTDIINETIVNNVEIIMKKLTHIRQYQQYLSDDDINIIESATSNIKNVVNNLNFLDTFTFKIYQRISGIAEKIH